MIDIESRLQFVERQNDDLNEALNYTNDEIGKLANKYKMSKELLEDIAEIQAEALKIRMRTYILK